MFKSYSVKIAKPQVKLWKRTPENDALIFGEERYAQGDLIECFDGEWRYQEVLGEGSFALVVKAVSTKARQAALKLFIKPEMFSSVPTSIKARTEFGGSEVIVDYLHDCMDKSAVALEFKEGDCMRDVFMERRRRDRLRVVHVLDAIAILRDLYCGLLEMEERGFFHGDIKHNNVVVKRENTDSVSGLPEPFQGSVTVSGAAYTDLDFFCNLEQAKEFAKQKMPGGTFQYFPPERAGGAVHKYSERWPVARMIKEYLYGRHAQIAKVVHIPTIKRRLKENLVYSPEQIKYFNDIHTRDELSLVEKPLRNLMYVLEVMESYHPERRGALPTSVDELMNFIFNGVKALTL